MLVITDGDNTAGLYEPLEASNIARAFGIDVYAIGIGGDIQVEQQQVSCVKVGCLRYAFLCR